MKSLFHLFAKTKRLLICIAINKTQSKKLKLLYLTMLLFSATVVYAALRALYIIVYRKWKQLPPGPIGYPFIGSRIHALFVRDWYQTNANKYGPIYHYYRGSKSDIMINESTLVKQLFGRRDCLDRKIPFPKCSEANTRVSNVFRSNDGYASVLEVSGAVWKWRRKYIQTALLRILTNTEVNKMMDLLCTDILVPHIMHTNTKTQKRSQSQTQSQRDTDTDPESLWFTHACMLEMTSATVFNACCGYGTYARNSHVYQETLRLDTKYNEELFAMVIANILPLMRYIRPQKYKNLMDIPRERNNALAVLIADAQKRILKNQNAVHNNNIDNGDDNNDNNDNKTGNRNMDSNGNDMTFIETIAKLVNDQKLKLGEAIADISILFFAGAETTSTTLDFAIVLIANNIALQQRLRRELLGNDSSKHNRVRTPSATYTIYGYKCVDLKQITQFPLFRAFIYESLRIATISRTGAEHCCFKDDVWIECGSSDLGENEKKKKTHRYRIPKGAIMHCNIDYIHRASKTECWQNEPFSDEICLKNWLKPLSLDNDDSNVSNCRFVMNESFMSFGYGRRDCVGRILAMKELYKIMAFLLLNYHLSLAEPIKDRIPRNATNSPVSAISPPIGIQIYKIEERQ